MKKLIFILLSIGLLACKKDTPTTPSTPVVVIDSTKVSVTIQWKYTMTDTVQPNPDSIWYCFSQTQDFFTNTDKAQGIVGYLKKNSYTWNFTLEPNLQVDSTLFIAQFALTQGYGFTDYTILNVTVNGKLRVCDTSSHPPGSGDNGCQIYIPH